MNIDELNEIEDFDELNKVVYIYELSFPDGDKYIGSAKNSQNRLESHKKFFGIDNISMKILKSVNESQRIKWEQYYIAHYYTIGEKLKNKNVGSGTNNISIKDCFKLSKKIQVLISEDDLKLLYIIISRKALEEGKRPLSASSYIRDLIKDHIHKEINIEQKSYVGDHIKKIIEEQKSKIS